MTTEWAIRHTDGKWEMVVKHHGEWNPLHRSHSRDTALSSGRRYFGTNGYKGVIAMECVEDMELNANL